MASDGLRDDLLRSLRIVWLVVAVVCGLAVMLPLFFPARMLAGWFPVCAAKAAGGSCLLCGMTTAFLQIGAGDLSGAARANAGSILLYAVMFANFAAALAYTMLRVIIYHTRHANS